MESCFSRSIKVGLEKITSMATFHVDPTIADAKTIDTSFYLSKKYFEESKEKIFATTWQFVGDLDQVKEKGWATPVNLLENFLNEPLVLSKDKDEKLYCLSNVCT